MLCWILQIAAISIIFIILIHHLFSYLKSTLTIPKIKDLVNSPIQKYQHIFDTISIKNNNNDDLDYLPNTKYSSDNDYTDIDLLPTDNTISNTIANSNNGMKNELKMFLKKQLNSTGNEL
jgi:hypothetical protein